MQNTGEPERVVTPAGHVQDATLFKLLVDRVADYAIFLLTPDGTVASWNTGAERLKGYTPDEIIGRHFERFYPEPDRAAGLPGRLLDRARDEGRVEHEGWRVRKDGSTFWADVIITALRTDDGELLGFAKVTRDLSERRATEERLRQGEQRLRTLIDNIKDYAIFMLAPDGTVLTWNQGAARIKGYAAHEIIGHSFKRFYTDEEREAGHPARLLGIARAEGRVEDEGWRVRKDGSRFWADVVITALTDPSDGRLIGYAKVTRDLTERRQAEQDRAARQAAERSAERMERLQVATAALAVATRREHAAEVLVDVATRALGATTGMLAIPTPEGDWLEVLNEHGSPPSARQLRHFRLEDPEVMAHAARTRQPMFLSSREQLPASYPELTMTRGDLVSQAWAAVPLVIDGRVIGVLGLRFSEPRIFDADDRGFLFALGEVGAQALDRGRLYELERAARDQAEAAVRAQDEFLSVAAHELRTPVAAVKATAQLAERAIARGQLDPSRIARHLQAIARSSDRLGALIEDLLDVSRLRTGRLRLRREDVELGSIVEEVVGRYGATEHAHRFSLRLPAQRWLVHADPLRVEQVLDNLLSNAVKYSPNGGGVEVGVREDRDGVVMTVADQGIGLPASYESLIFEPFGRGANASERQIQGLGLGLAICRQLVELHGGRIWAASPGEGQGTTFSVWLPIVLPTENGAHA